MEYSFIWMGFTLGYILANRASYRNGAIDAYHFAREPLHPGGRKAGRIIYKNLSHMYGDITNPDGEDCA